MRRRFFIDHFDSSSATLTGDPADHLGRVLRAAPGQLYELSDGQQVNLARIERIALSKNGKSRIEFALLESIPAQEPRLQIELLLSLVKFDRFEWCLEKATELGATTIVPLAAARTDKPLIAAAPKRHERWQKILLESTQQSRRLRPPQLAGAIAPEKAFAASASAITIILSERPNAPSLRTVLGGVSSLSETSQSRSRSPSAPNAAGRTPNSPPRTPPVLPKLRSARIFSAPKPPCSPPSPSPNSLSARKHPRSRPLCLRFHAMI